MSDLLEDLFDLVDIYLVRFLNYDFKKYYHLLIFPNRNPKAFLGK